MSHKKNNIVTIPVSEPRPFEEVLTPVEVGRRLKLPASNDDELTQKVYELTRRRAARPLPSIKVGKLIRFYWSEVDRWLREGLRQAA
jgi:hypothetical protein